MKDNKEEVVQTQSLMYPSTTVAGATIAVQIIKILEENKLTIAQSKQILIDVENAIYSQKIRSNVQNVELSVFYELKTIGISPQTIGIIDYATK